MGAGVVAFVVSFFPYYGGSRVTAVSVSTPGAAGHWSACYSSSLPPRGCPARVRRQPAARAAGGWAFVVAASVLGALMIFIRSVTLPSGSALGLVDYGVRFGGWLLIIVAIVQVIFAVRAFLASGEQLPGRGAPRSQPPVV